MDPEATSVAVGVRHSRPAARISLRLARRAVRLVGDVRDRGADADDWRPLLVRRLRGLARADIAISSEVFLTPRPRKDEPERVSDVGWMCSAIGGAEPRTVRVEQVCDRPPEDLLQMVRGPDGQGRALRPVLTLRAGGHMVLSQVTLPHIAAVDQLSVYRSAGPPLGRSMARLVRLVHVELARFWRRDVLRAAVDPTADLPPRLGQTLEHLCAGASEKEIARALALSPHTVHNYVKALHKRFDIASRGELLAKANELQNAADRPFRPRLAAEARGVGDRE